MEPFLLYSWGAWVWFFRGLALIAYGTGVMIIPLVNLLFRDTLQEPSFTNLLLLGLVILLLGAWVLWALITFRNGQARVVKLWVDREASCLIVSTLNFSRRRIPLEAIGLPEGDGAESFIADWYNDAMLTVPVVGQGPLRIDLVGKVYDRALFKELFGRLPPDIPGPGRSLGRRRRPRRKKADPASGEKPEQ
jgi:hypothetical protein